MSEDMYTAAGLKLVCTPKNCEKRAARKGRNRVDDICNTILWHFHVQHDAKRFTFEDASDLENSERLVDSC